MAVQKTPALKTRPIGEGRSGYRHPMYFADFLFLCPKTKEVDRGDITIDYAADDVAVDPKSFEEYLTSFRSTEIGREAVVNQILDDVVKACHPRNILVRGQFRLRDSFRVRIESRYPLRHKSVSDGISRLP